jgi:hypothetical protein
MHIVIGFTGYRTRDLPRSRRALYRLTEKHSRHMWLHSIYVPNYDSKLVDPMRDAGIVSAVHVAHAAKLKCAD